MFREVCSQGLIYPASLLLLPYSLGLHQGQPEMEQPSRNFIPKLKEHFNFSEINQTSTKNSNISGTCRWGLIYSPTPRIAWTERLKIYALFYDSAQKQSLLSLAYFVSFSSLTIFLLELDHRQWNGEVNYYKPSRVFSLPDGRKWEAMQITSWG